MAEQFATAGLAAYAVDLRGRGNSDGERFYVDRFEDYASDVEAVVNVARSREPDLPFFLLGRSAGGVVSCLYALDHQGELAGLICESFAHELPAPDFALAVFKGLGYLAPHAHILHLPNERFSRDPQVVEAMNRDPLIAHETQPTRTMAALVRADERLKKEFPLLTLPVLILHGAGDQNTRPSGSQHFCDMVGSVDKTLKLYEGGLHDLLNDLDKRVVMQDIENWIGAPAFATRKHVKCHTALRRDRSTLRHRAIAFRSRYLFAGANIVIGIVRARHVASDDAGPTSPHAPFHDSRARRNVSRTTRHVMTVALQLFILIAAICLSGGHAMAAEGLTTIKSHFGPEDTVKRLEAEVKARGMTVFARIPHAKGAAAVGVPLRPNDLLIFGNAKVGTPLMNSAPTIGIDLPLKVLVWQDADGSTWLAYNDPTWVARRHGLRPDVEASVETMTGALHAVIGAAAGSE